MDIGWLKKNATSISDRERKKGSFRVIACEDRGDKIVRFFIDQQGQYRYESTKK